MNGPWAIGMPGTLLLPDGRLVRGRSLRHGPSAGQPPEHSLFLLGRRPAEPGWSMRWIRWPDFRPPFDRADALDGLVQAWQRAAAERVEVACAGGIGRTGTALACLAVLSGLGPDDAIRTVRAGYHRRAVETPGQRRFIRWFAGQVDAHPPR